MALRVDIRVHAKGNAGVPALRARDLGDAVELAGRFGVDGADAVRDGGFQLLARLADAGEDDVARLEAGAARDGDLSAGVRVGPAAERAQQPDDGERRVGLERVVNGVRVRRERLVDARVRLANSACVVDVDRSADAIDDRSHADAIAQQTAVSRHERLVQASSDVIMRAIDTRTPAIEEIIERCLGGDQSAWDEIVRRYRRTVFNIAYKFTGRYDLAEDLTQDVFLKLFRSLDTF